MDKPNDPYTTLISVATQNSAMLTASAVREVESTIRTLQKVAADLAAGNASWWEQGANTSLMTARVIQAAAAQADLQSLLHVCEASRKAAAREG